MPFNMFPYSNLHGLNADWLLKTVKEAAHDAGESAESAAASAAIAEGVQGQITELDGRVEACETGLSHAVKFTPQTLTLLQQGQARNNIGAISAGELSDSGAVIYNHEQALTTEQKAVARENIGAVANNASALSQAGAVTYGSEQSLTDTQKARARTNIGAISAADIPSATGTVQYDQAQSLTDSQKAQARSNISAAAASDIPNVTDVLRYSAQSLTASQKAQARQNIGVSNEQDQPFIVTIWPNEQNTGYEIDQSLADIITQMDAGRLSVFYFTPISSSIGYFATMNIDDTSAIKTATADVFNPNQATSSAPTFWYHIYLANNGSSDTLIVTENYGRFAPDCSISDNDKVLTVSAGKPVWMQNGPTVVSDQVSTSITLNPQANTEYHYSTLASLTISNPPATGAYSIVFTSGSTPTNVTIPDPPAMRWQTDDNKPPQGFPAANTRYEINVENTYVVLGEWPVPEVSA